MSRDGLTRRDVLGSVMAAGSLAAVAAAGKPAPAAEWRGHSSPEKQEDFPTFRLATQAQEGRVTAGGSAKQATVEERPISEGIAGVSMRLKPRGYGHYIENVGDSPCRALVGFHSGDYQEISLTSWLASNPVSLLADNFCTTESLVTKFPDHRVFIAGKNGPGA